MGSLGSANSDLRVTPVTTARPIRLISSAHSLFGPYFFRSIILRGVFESAIRSLSVDG
jgi:hypothetical protein